MSATPMTIDVVRTVSALRTHVARWRQDGQSVGFVPTMGALHDGHGALIRAGLQACDRVVVSIFVNPTQFGPDEDFDTYPRDEDGDIQYLHEQGVHLLFAPNMSEIYGPEDKTQVQVAYFNTLLEGLCRPGHFDGVATVVSKLLNQVQADHVYFGEKDFQQFQVISHLVKDLYIPTQVHGVPTVREADGLALSSRNVKLSSEARAIAPKLYAVLKTIEKGFCNGQHAGRLELDGREALMAAGFDSVDYLVVADAVTLQPLNLYEPDRPARILGAVKLGGVRLIDNIPVSKA